MTDWQPWTPNWTYKRTWRRKLLFWRYPKIITPITRYKQVGKTVYIEVKKK